MTHWGKSDFVPIREGETGGQIFGLFFPFLHSPPFRAAKSFVLRQFFHVTTGYSHTVVSLSVVLCRT